MWLLLLACLVANAADPTGADPTGADPVRPALPLSEAWDRAVRDNPEIREARLALEEARLALRQARGAFDPTLGVGVDRGVTAGVATDAETGQRAATHTTSTAWSVAVDQALPTGGTVGLAWTETRADNTGSAARTTWDDGAWLTLTQPLLEGLGPVPARAGVRRAARDLDRQVLAWQGALEDLLLEVSAAWWRAVVAEESLALAARSLAVAEGQGAETRARLEQGFAGLNDLLQVERQVGVARQAYVNAGAEAEAARFGLCRQLGVPLAACPVFQLPRPDVAGAATLPAANAADPTLDEALAVAWQRNVAFLDQRLEVAQAEDDLRVARWNALPSLDLGGSVGWSGLADGPEDARAEVFTDAAPGWAVGVDLSLPLPGRDPWAGLAQTRLARDRALLRLEAAAQDLEGEVREALRDVSRDRARVDLARQTVAAADKALALDQELYREGRCSSRDVVLSLEGLDAAQATRLAVEASLQASLLRLEQVRGVLIDRLGADPTARP